VGGTVRYLETKVSHQSVIEAKIIRRLNSDNAFHHSVQYLLSTRLLSKNVKIRIYETVILPVVLCWYET
jgi:hypothetical protein